MSDPKDPDKYATPVFLFCIRWTRSDTVPLVRYTWVSSGWVGPWTCKQSHVPAMLRMLYRRRYAQRGMPRLRHWSFSCGRVGHRVGVNSTKSPPRQHRAQGLHGQWRVTLAVDARLGSA